MDSFDFTEAMPHGAQTHLFLVNRRMKTRKLMKSFHHKLLFGGF
jgi:hypothetical protein